MARQQYWLDLDMEAEVGARCEAHHVPLTIWCCTDSAVVCAKCLLFGDHRGHKYLDEEETK